MVAALGVGIREHRLEPADPPGVPHAAGDLDHRALHAEADPEEGDAVLPGVPDRLDLARDPQVARMTGQVLDGIRGGASLSEAIGAQAGVFSKFYVSMVRAGEMGGALDQVLKRLSEYLARAKELRDSIVSALIYPAILMTVSVGSVFLLMVFVVPHFTQLFDDAGRTLPMLTQIVVGTAEFLRAYWWILVGGVLVGGARPRHAAEDERGQQHLDVNGDRGVDDLASRVEQLAQPDDHRRIDHDPDPGDRDPDPVHLNWH